ncbi:unnamed protein product [Musa hybrid cultivar]
MLVFQSDEETYLRGLRLIWQPGLPSLLSSRQLCVNRRRDFRVTDPSLLPLHQSLPINLPPTLVSLRGIRPDPCTVGGSSMESAALKREQKEKATKRARGKYLKIHVVCKASAALATLIAAALMGFNKQISNVAGFEIKATYNSSPAFKFFVIGNAIACGYSVLSLPFAAHMVEGWMLNLFDLMNLGLVMAAASAAAAIGYVGKYGNDEIGWTKVCPYYEKFCGRTEISIACSYVGFLLFLFVCVMSSVYRSRLSNSD